MSISPSVETDLQCGGYYIYSNTFTQNAGCPNYVGSVIKFDCVETTYTTSYYDKPTFSTFASDSTTLSNYKSNI